MLKNAFQAIPEDRKPEISVNISEKDDNVNISISDNGYGISKLDTEKIKLLQKLQKENII